jgi:RNA polymerase sigma factor (sigma-70 family)
VTIRVFILDDHEVVRHGLRRLIESTDDMVVVGEAAGASGALAAIAASQPNVAILDVRLPDGNGVEVCREVRSRHPEIACLILTSYADDEALAQSVLAGAAGYVLKDVAGLELLRAIRTAAAGGTLVDRATARQVLEQLEQTSKLARTLSSLTPRERQILELIADGLTNRQIGERLFLAEKTVKNNVSRLLAKLGMQRRTEAAAFGARLRERRS